MFFKKTGIVTNDNAEVRGEKVLIPVINLLLGFESYQEKLQTIFLNLTI